MLEVGAYLNKDLEILAHFAEVKSAAEGENVLEYRASNSTKISALGRFKTLYGHADFRGRETNRK
jgi:hypothetical protein